MADDPICRGLEGIKVDETGLSYVDGDNGILVIRGFPLAELAINATFEETLYLLYNGHLPSETELDQFSDDLTRYRELPEGTLNLIQNAAESKTDPMDALRMGTASLDLDFQSDDPEQASMMLVARLPTIAAAYWRYRNGDQPLSPREDLSHAANFLYMLQGEEPTDAKVAGLETYLNTVVDHGFNASTFTARTIVSTESDLVSAITGAIGSLKGPLHGGAPGPVLDMLREIEQSGDISGSINGRLEAGERLMGFGHRVYNVRDPRAEVLSTAAEQFYQDGGNSAFFDLAMEVEEVAIEALQDHRPDLQLQTNVEFYTAVLLHGIGIPDELFTTTFAIARSGGWTAHCLEQIENNRIIRPLGEYVGEKDRTWTPLEDR